MEQIEKIKNVVAKILTGVSTGSGFYHKNLNAFITNFHVVQGERRVCVELSNGDKIVGNVLVANPQKDIALITVDRALDLPQITLQDKKVAQQEKVFALGYPYDLPFTVTEGIVSSPEFVDREVKYIQTDAALNPGNSGGPLVNGDGEIVGMNTQVFRNAQNIGFALPVEYIVEEISMFREDEVTEGYNVRCPSCSDLVTRQVEYCDNCGTQLSFDAFFQQRPLNPLEQFVESKLAGLGVDPILARKGMPDYWEYYRGSAQIRIFVYRNDFLFSTSPLVRLPRKGLVELYTYLLSDPVPPYRFTMTDDVIYLAYRTHLGDLADPDQRGRIGNELMALGQRADELDNFLIEKFNCQWATQSKQDSA
jgi:serine protease Do